MQKIQDSVVDTVKGVVNDPAGAAAKAAGQAKGALALGKMMAGQVTKTAADKIAGVSGLRSEPPVPPREEIPERHAAEPVEHAGEVTPNDVARVVAKKAPPAKKAPAKKAPPKKTTPSAKLPAKKAPAKKAPAKKAPPPKKAPAAEAAPTEAPPEGQD